MDDAAAWHERPAEPRLHVAVCVSGCRPLVPGALNYLAASLPRTAKVDYFFYFLRAGYATVGDVVGSAAFTGYGADPTFHVTVDNEFQAVITFPHLGFPGSVAEDVVNDCFAVRQCNGMKTAQETVQGFEYDLVVRQRPDYVVSEPFDLALYAPVARNFIVIPDATGTKGDFKDTIAFSSSRNMDVYAGLLDIIPEYCGFECALDGELLMRFHIMRARLEVIWRPAGEWGVMLPIRSGAITPSAFA